jgi:hypothetical protein
MYFPKMATLFAGFETKVKVGELLKVFPLSMFPPYKRKGLALMPSAHSFASGKILIPLFDFRTTASVVVETTGSCAQLVNETPSIMTKKLIFFIFYVLVW